MNDRALRDGVLSVAKMFLDAIASRDCDQMLALCSDNAVFEWPMMRARIEDPQIFRKSIGPALAPMEGLRFHDVTVDEMLDPNVVTLRYTGTATMSTTGKPYLQTYITQIRVDNGRVAAFREYFDRQALEDSLTPD